MANMRLKDFGTTFATRQRADSIVYSIETASRHEPLILDFNGVKTASPSFLDSLIGGLSEITSSVEVIRVGDDSLTDLIERVIERRGLSSRFRILAAA